MLCDPKSAAQIDAIVAHASELGRRLLLTRLAERKFGAARRRRRATRSTTTRRRAPRSSAALPRRAVRGRIAIVCGGTSDAPVAREAARTLAFEGESATLIVDVGVAGLWRLMERIDEIRRHRVVIAVAGMEGALFSVLAGLVPCPVLAVPTSVGYGVGARAAGRRCARRSRAARRGLSSSTSTTASARRTPRCASSATVRRADFVLLRGLRGPPDQPRRRPRPASPAAASLSRLEIPCRRRPLPPVCHRLAASPAGRRRSALRPSS